MTDANLGRPHRGARARSASQPALFANIAVICLIVTALTEWLGSAVMRLVGSYTKVAFLQGASPADAIAAGLTLLATVMLFFVPTRAFILRWAFLLGTGALMMLLIVQAALGGPETPDPWNTRFDEISRTSIILLMYFVYFQLSSSTLAVSPRLAKLSFWAIYVCGAACFVFAVLQSMGLLNNLYFQWYVNAHLPRPAGGFSHPHYYAASCVIASAAVIMMARRRYISMPHAFAYAGVMLVGTALSTSRVGLISAAAALIVYALFVARRNPGRLFVIIAGTLGSLLLALLAIAVLSEFSDTLAKSFRGVTKAYEVFTSVFGGDGTDMLRGRGDHWAHEIEVITADPGALFFGAGYQPYVSHNLFLRQLQVSGIFGTIAYTILLVALILQTRNRAVPTDRDLVWVAWTPILVSLNTLPILTSVTLNAALMLIAFLATLPIRTPTPRRAFGAGARRFGAANLGQNPQPRSI